MKHLLFKLQSFLVLLVFTAASAYAQKSPVDMNRFIDDLMKKMTLEEKIGQLNLPVTGEITTGQAKSSNVAKRIRAGEVGGLFNLKGVERIRDVQKQAVEESRLGIPLLFGMDVIHGYETVFPIPLGLSCTWDMKAVEESARIAAIESSADGICWTFSPMVDICRDARWGRVSEGNGEDPFLGAAIAQAMRALPDEDREIFYRFYDLSQTAAQIAEDLHLNASTVRSRLMRGRRTLREALEKGGLFCEDDVG